MSEDYRKLDKQLFSTGEAPMVSVVIPVYNSETYLDECLDSVCQQTYRNLQIIVINDGSVDESLRLVRKIAESDSRITVINQQHGGPSSARNAGIREAVGEYMTFVDSDDLIDPSYIEQLVFGIGTADFCMCGFRLCKHQKDQWIVQEGITAEFIKKEIFDHIGDYQKLIAGIGWRMYRTSFIRKNKILFSEEICLAEDTLFFCKALLYANRASFIMSSGYIIRKLNPHSLTRSEILNIGMMVSVLRMYCELSCESDHPGFIREMYYRQIEVLGWAGKKICYQIKGIRKRKDVFFALVDRTDVCSGIRAYPSRSMTDTAVRITLALRMFLPYYLLVMAWGALFPEKRNGFISRSGS